MDSIGNLQLSWAQGYNGSQAKYINRDTLCFRCGNNIKFLQENGESKMFPSGAEGLGPIAVHSINKVFAVAELGIKPKINIFQYPSFDHIRELTDGAKLEYIYFEFSASNYLATVTGVPDYKLIIWNYVTGQQLCEYEVPHEVPTNIAFDPANWRELSISYESDLHVYKIEQSDEHYLITQHKLKLPSDDVPTGYTDSSPNADAPTRASTNMHRVNVKIPISAITGIEGEEAERFDEYQRGKTRVKPLSLCWLPSGDLLIGCRGGQLIKVNVEELKTTMLYNPGPNGSNPVSRNPSALMPSKSTILEEGSREDYPVSRGTSFLQAEGSATSMDLSSVLTYGSFNCLTLHKSGLFAAGSDGVVRKLHLTELAKNNVKLTDMQPLGFPITSMSFNTSYTKLAIGSSRGILQVMDHAELSKVQQILDLYHGKLVAVDTLAPGLTHCMTARQNGELQVWNIENATLVSSFSVGAHTTTLSTSRLGHTAAVGTVNGDVFFIDYTDINQIRIVQRIKLHDGPVRHIVFNENGQFFLSGSDDGHVFVLDGRPSTNFQPLGHVSMPGEIHGIATYFHQSSKNTKVAVTSNSTKMSKLGANKITHFLLPHDLAKDIEIKHETLQWDLKESVINRLNFNLANPSFGVALADLNTVFVLSQNTKQIHKINLPDEPPKKANSKDSYLHPIANGPGPQLAGGRLIMSPHLKWIGSVSRDGKLCVRTVGALDRTTDVNAHDYREGGITSLVFTADTHNVLTIGDDGVISCYKWNFHPSYQNKAAAAVKNVHDKQKAMSIEIEIQDNALKAMTEWKAGGVSRTQSNIHGTGFGEKDLETKIQEAIDSDEIYHTPTPVPGKGSTWLTQKKLEAHKQEDLQYKDTKTDLRTHIREMRRQLQAMMKENEVVPDIEKLAHDEFDLDVEEQERLQAEGEAEVKRIREEKELENLAKMYLASLIKKECWEGMEVKGRGLSAFNSDMEVHNYPMKARSLDEMRKLAIVQTRRKIEVSELTQRKEIAEIQSKTAIDDEENGDDEEGKEKPSTTGSLGANYGGDSELFYSQFELHTREQKMNQIVLLQDAIYRIRKEFNKHFDDVYSKKQSEMNKVKEKNKRIKKILQDLRLPVELREPNFGSIEKPEMLLTVEEDEIKVEKYLTPEQRKKKDEEEKLEAERKAKERKDNWRERGLDQMMGGVLEIKKEDELKKDVPKPAFMLNKKEEDWSDEEKKLVIEYEKKVKELNEEREKYKKQLEMELKKLQGIVNDTFESFDETLKHLFIRKIKTEMVVYQEELKIVCMKFALLQEEELAHQENDLVRLLSFKKQKKLHAHEAVTESKKNVEAFRDLYDTLQAEDKVMDREFKRKFNDIPSWQQDQLHRLFRRRPRGQRVRGTETPMFDPSSGNPFAERPSTARQKDLAKKSQDTAMLELDNIKHCPDNVEEEVWMRLCNYRHQKIESENLVKEKALILAEMQAFLQKRIEEDERLQNEIDDHLDNLKKLKEDKIRFNINLQVQLLLKQGQVEVDQGHFIPDYTESLLVHRHVVEDLNSKIRHLGEGKIASMMESKDFRKGIVQLEWEHKKMTMEMEDLQNKMRDIQMMKVTREIQGYLGEENHENKIQNEIAVLEQTMLMLKDHHEQNLEERKKILKELKKNIKERKTENNELSATLEELNVSVNERRNIHEVNGSPIYGTDKQSDAGREHRYREIVQRRKLVDLAKAQAQEVAVLRAEVERLRMRTFPALVQVEH